MASFEIINYQKLVPDAFHGTDLETATTIRDEQSFKGTTDEKEYLGNGVYFFENSKWHAIDWGRRKCKKEGNKDLGVILATVNLGKCLDLNNLEHRGIVKSVINHYEEKGYKDILDGVAINFIYNKFNIDSARATIVTPEVGKIHKKSRFFDYSYLMICIKNKDNIQNINLCYQETCNV